MNHKTNFDFGSRSLINRKQFISTYRDSYQKPIRSFQPNQGINSDTAKRIHYKFTNIEYGLKDQ